MWTHRLSPETHLPTSRPQWTPHSSDQPKATTQLPNTCALSLTATAGIRPLSPRSGSTKGNRTSSAHPNQLLTFPQGCMRTPFTCPTGARACYDAPVLPMLASHPESSYRFRPQPLRLYQASQAEWAGQMCLLLLLLLSFVLKLYHRT